MESGGPSLPALQAFTAGEIPDRHAMRSRYHNKLLTIRQEQQGFDDAIHDNAAVSFPMIDHIQCSHQMEGCEIPDSYDTLFVTCEQIAAVRGDRQTANGDGFLCRPQGMDGFERLPIANHCL